MLKLNARSKREARTDLGASCSISGRFTAPIVANRISDAHVSATHFIGGYRGAERLLRGGRSGLSFSAPVALEGTGGARQRVGPGGARVARQPRALVERYSG